MSWQWLGVGFRLAAAALVVVALTTQYVDGHTNNPTFSPVNFFSFFTVLSNVFSVLAFSASAAWLARGRPLPRWLDLFRGATAVYMGITAIVFALLLRGLQEELQLTIPWVDTVLHRVMPIMVVGDWLIDPPRRRFSLRAAAIWMVFPLAYLPYSLIRGPIVDWYPYPFLDPGQEGWDHVVVTSVAIFEGFAIAIAVAWALGNRRRLTWLPAA